MARVTINLPLRLTYPFLPAISRGLGVSLSAAGALVSVRSLAGMGSPLFGALADRVGGRRVMLLGVALVVAGATLTAGLSVYGVALVGFALMGLAKSAFDPAMYAYISRRVPYERRGRIMGVNELAWSATWLGIPVSGWLIDHAGWRVPFALIGGLGLAGGWLIRRRLAPGRGPRLDKEHAVNDTPTDPILAPVSSPIWRDGHAWLALSITGLLMLAQDNLIVVYGAWLEDVFGLSVTALGVVSLLIGVAEATAELGAALLADRLGKRRAVFGGLVLTAGGYLLLPRLTTSLPVALIGTALVVLAFEFSIVSFIPLVSGLSAEAPGTLMSLNVTAFAAGRMIAAPLAVALYRPGDLTRNGLLSAMMCLFLLGLLSRLQERGH